MAYDNNDKKQESIYSQRIRAGKRRTYFFDVRTTRSNDYYLTITESRKRNDDNGYDRHKVFLYKEDFNKFVKALGEAVDYVKTELMPDFDFDAFNHDEAQEEMGTHNGESHQSTAQDDMQTKPVENIETPVSETKETDSNIEPINTEEVDKW